MSLNIFTGANAPEIKPIDWLVNGFLARGAGTILFGQPGVSKTAHCAVLVASLCMGKPFAGMAITGQHRVLYLDLDAGWNWAGPLFMAAFRGAGLEGMPESFAYWSPLTPECELEGEARGTASLEFLGSLIEETVKEHRADLVVVDSLGQFMAGDSNSAQDMSIGLRLGLNGARAAGAAVLVIDHATKAARVNGQMVPTPAGSQQKRAWARVTVALEEEGDGATRWSVDKTNAQKFEPFITCLHFQNDSSGQLDTLRLELIGEAGPRNPTVSPLVKTIGAIMSILKENGGEARRMSFGKSGTVDRALKELLETGQIENPERGVYRLAETFTNSPAPRGGELVKETKTDSPDTFTNSHQDGIGGEIRE